MIITFDFETYFSSTYTLSKLTTAEYILHPEFLIHGVGVKVDDGEVHWHRGPDLLGLKAQLSIYPWEEATAVAHNAPFDGAILEWRLGIHPKKYFCTMMGARPSCAPYTKSMALGALAKHFDLPLLKDMLTLDLVKGVRELDNHAASQLGGYCKTDTNIAWSLYHELVRTLSEDEQDLIDLTVKKYTRPKLHLDKDVLRKRLKEIQLHKQAALDAAGVAKTTLMSNPKLASQLVSMGVRPPTKISPATGKTTYAFARTDLGFLKLKAHSNKRVGAVVEARLAVKSTMEETRIQRMLDIGRYTTRVPVPLLYYGAHTGRWSGLDKLNFQNLPRGSALRKALVAPPGYVVLAADLSQIEARILATLAKQENLRLAFANKEDVYASFASKVYGYPVDKDEHPTERRVGKVAILGLGYGLGYNKFCDVMNVAGITMSSNMAYRIVNTYRTTYSNIPALWAFMDQIIHTSLVVPGTLRVLGPLVIGHEHIRLPNGQCLAYPKLRIDQATRKYVYDNPKSGTITLWGGSATENIVQALARIVLSDAELFLARRGLRAALPVHDELVFVVPERHVEAIAGAVYKTLTRPVSWLPGLPLECEVHYGKSYFDAK